MSVQAVAVHVRDRDAGAVVVVRRLVGDGRVIDHAVPEGEAARRPPIRELKIMERRHAGSGLDLRGRELREPRGVLQVVGGEAEGARRSRRLPGADRASRARRQHDGRGRKRADDDDRGRARARRSIASDEG